MMLARNATALAALGVLLLGATAAHAQSFNCRYARTADEVLICQDPRLAQLDEQMASLYFRLRNSLPRRERFLLEAGQRSWLSERMSCGRDAGCIAAAYIRRIRQLSAY